MDYFSPHTYNSSLSFSLVLNPKGKDKSFKFLYLLYMDLSVLERVKWLQQQQMVSPDFFEILGSDGREELKRVESYLGNNNDELQSFRHYETIDGCISRTSSFQIEQVKNNEENRVIALQHKRKTEVCSTRNHWFLGFIFFFETLILIVFSLSTFGYRVRQKR